MARCHRVQMETMWNEPRRRGESRTSWNYGRLWEDNVWKSSHSFCPHSLLFCCFPAGMKDPALEQEEQCTMQGVCTSFWKSLSTRQFPVQRWMPAVRFWGQDRYQNSHSHNWMIIGEWAISSTGRLSTGILLWMYCLRNGGRLWDISQGHIEWSFLCFNPQTMEIPSAASKIFKAGFIWTRKLLDGEVRRRLDKMTEDRFNYRRNQFKSRQNDITHNILRNKPVKSRNRPYFQRCSIPSPTPNQLRHLLALAANFSASSSTTAPVVAPVVAPKRLARAASFSPSADAPDADGGVVSGRPQRLARAANFSASVSSAWRKLFWEAKGWL